MATNTMNGSILNQAGYNDRWGNYGSTGQYAGFGTTSYFTTIVAFQTPAFQGVSEGVEITLCVTKNGNNSNPTLRWALATSDVNRNMYVNTTSEVTSESDSTQVAYGVHQFQGVTASGTNSTIVVETSDLKPSTTYYLYLWGYESDNWLTVYQSKSHSVSVGYNSGLVYIDSGNGFDAYVVYIDNSSGWDQCIPYIDNGSGWDMCS